MTLRISHEPRGYYVQERYFFFWCIPTSSAFTTLGWDYRHYKFFDTLEEADEAVRAFIDSKKAAQTKPRPIYKYKIFKDGYRIEKC